MPEIIIIIVLMMACLNLFLFFLLERTVKTVNKQIQQTFLKRLEVYDDAYDQNAERLAEVRKELEKAKAELSRVQEERAMSMMPTVVSEPTAVRGFRPAPSYRNEDVWEDYRYIRRHFRPDVREIVRSHLEEAVQKENREAKLSQSLLEKFPFELRCQMMSLQAEEQQEVIEAALPAEEYALYEEWKENGGKGDFSGFLDYVQQYVKLHRSGVHVITSDPDTCLDDMGSMVTWEYSPLLHEGCQVICGNQIYDYSL